MVAGMVMPLTDLRAIYERLFRDGVLVAKKDKRPRNMHPEIPGVSNLQVIQAMRSMKSKGFVKETFAWRHCYWYLTNTGIVYLRDFLHLPPEIVPSSLHRTHTPASMSNVPAVQGPACYVSRPHDGRKSPEVVMDQRSYRRKTAQAEAQRERSVKFRGGYRPSSPTYGTIQRDDSEVEDGQARGLRSSVLERIARPSPPVMAMDQESVASKPQPKVKPLPTVRPSPPLTASPPSKAKSPGAPPDELSTGLGDKKAVVLELTEELKETVPHHLLPLEEGLIVETEALDDVITGDVPADKIVPETHFGQIPTKCTPELASVTMRTPESETLDKELMKISLNFEIETDIITQEPVQDISDSKLPAHQIAEGRILQEAHIEPIKANSSSDPSELLEKEQSVPQKITLKISSSPDDRAFSKEEYGDEAKKTWPDFSEELQRTQSEGWTTTDQNMKGQHESTLSLLYAPLVLISTQCLEVRSARLSVAVSFASERDRKAARHCHEPLLLLLSSPSSSTSEWGKTKLNPTQLGPKENELNRLASRGHCNGFVHHRLPKWSYDQQLRHKGASRLARRAWHGSGAYLHTWPGFLSTNKPCRGRLPLPARILYNVSSICGGFIRDSRRRPSPGRCR
ncbi:hypothetical protein AOLI_G00321460 [Acnodon oligacanthus]